MTLVGPNKYKRSCVLGSPALILVAGRQSIASHTSAHLLHDFQFDKKISGGLDSKRLPFKASDPFRF